MGSLKNYLWPGNICELQYIIEPGVALSDGPILILSQNLFPPSNPGQPSPWSAIDTSPAFSTAGPKDVATSTDPAAVSSALSLEDIKRRRILSISNRPAVCIEEPEGAVKVRNL